MIINVSVPFKWCFLLLSKGFDAFQFPFLFSIWYYVISLNNIEMFHQGHFLHLFNTILHQKWLKKFIFPLVWHIDPSTHSSAVFLAMVNFVRQLQTNQKVPTEFSFPSACRTMVQNSIWITISELMSVILGLVFGHTDIWKDRSGSWNSYLLGSTRFAGTS